MRMREETLLKTSARAGKYANNTDVNTECHIKQKTVSFGEGLWNIFQTRTNKVDIKIRFWAGRRLTRVLTLLIWLETGVMHVLVIH